MYKDPNSSSGSGTSAKGDEVELVSRFLAPLCARDEAARNIALAAARTTVEGWLGGVGSPNQWEDTTEIENTSDEYRKFKAQDGRYDMSIERSPQKPVPKLPEHRRNDNLQQIYTQTHHSLQDAFRMESFFPRSVMENPTPSIRDNSLDTSEKFTSESYDCVDGKFGNESQSYGGTRERWPRQTVMGMSEGFVEKLGRSNSSDEGKGFNIMSERSRRFRENSVVETRFSSSNESERKFIGYVGNNSRDMYDEACNDDPKQQRVKSFGKIGKATRQKQLDDDYLDSDTRIYGKSPKFDESHGGNFGPYESLSKSVNYPSRKDYYGTRYDRDVERYDRRNLNIRSAAVGLKFYEHSDETSFDDEYSPRFNRHRDGVVFNTLEGFDQENMNATSSNANEDEIDEYGEDDDEEHSENMNLENPDDGNYENVRLESCFGFASRPSDDPLMMTKNTNQPTGQRAESYEEHYLRNGPERKFSAGQIKRPLSQDEDVSSKSGRTLEGPEVTPGDVGRMLNLGNALDGPRQAQPNKYLSLVTLHLPVILRLSVNCPFENVRIKCAEILQMVKDRGLPVPEPAFEGPSAFVPTSELPDLNSLDEKTHMLLMDAFLQNNRLDHVSRVMSSHPTYLETFLRTQNFILRGDGPLPYDYRHLIAIMAAGRHQCSYLINQQKSEFLLQGGDPSWLRGLKSLPKKLQNLYEINKLLAHRPWLLRKTHIAKLTKGDDSWSLAEVVHALVLLSHFHSLASFIFSCGINEELDNVAGHLYKENVQVNSNTVKPSKDKLMNSPKKIPNSGGKTETIPSPPLSPSIVGEQEVGVETLMERMKRLSEKSESYQITQEELSKRFETVETQSAELAAAPQRSSSVLDSDIGHFIEDPTFIYQDFAKRGQLNDIPTFRVQDYSWDDHGFSLVNRLYNDVGNLLDDKFKTAYNLTYYTMGTHNKVDTSRFRRAIWNYIQCMFGIRHDDYDYNEVNQLLERSLKTFIKSAVCYPERVTKRDYDRVMREFKHSEKVHVNLMILEARMQAGLLYALRAVMRHMT